jgi:hypothetical protein
LLLAFEPKNVTGTSPAWKWRFRPAGTKYATLVSPPRRVPMPSSAYTLFRNAILAEQQVVCTYDGRRRELCPHIIGTSKTGEEVVLAWQFAGESSGPLPQWRCLRLANVRDAQARSGRWHEGGSHRTAQSCVSAIDLDINIQVRKRRKPGAR